MSPEQYLLSKRSLDPKCDFCGSPDIIWCYPCADFDMREVGPWGSVGAFAACEPCADLIEKDRRRALAVRGLSQYGHPLGLEERTYILSCVRQMHDKFFALRRGERVPHAS